MFRMEEAEVVSSRWAAVDLLNLLEQGSCAFEHCEAVNEHLRRHGVALVTVRRTLTKA